jgi:hypothetical protein
VRRGGDVDDDKDETVVKGRALGFKVAVGLISLSGFLELH